MKIMIENISQENVNYQIILFDGVCNFCNGSVNFIIDHDPSKQFKFASLQSPIGQDILRKYNQNTCKFDSVILLKNNRLYQRSSAILEIVENLSGAWKYLSILKVLPSSWLDFFYVLMAKHRYTLFGKSETCRILTPELKERFL
jgi:predicted DCC family thiol-disulfide oxidoreductase YuxK